MAGLLLALVVYALIHFLNGMDREQRARQGTLHSLEAATAVMNATWERTARLAGNAVRQLHGASESRAQAALTPYRISWPGAVFCIYDKQGNQLAPSRPADNPETAPVPHTVRNLVQKAVFGQSATGFTSVRGFMALSVGLPIRGGDASALVVAVPLDTLALDELKKTLRADIAVLSLKDFTSEELTPLTDSASTFHSSEREAARANNALAPFLKGDLTDTAFFDFGREGVPAAISPLAGPDGIVAGALVIAPLHAVPAASPLLPAAAALAAGLLGFVVTALGLRSRNDRLAALIARAVDDFTENVRARRVANWKDTGWPEPVAESLDKLAVVFHDRRSGRDRRERPRNNDAESVPCSDSGGSAPFLRLFDNVPVGVFQTDHEGRFIRVNPAFAMMLGYNSVELLRTHCSSFSKFFLYAGGLLNPLSALAEEQGTTHNVSLRRQDGKVGHFALALSFLPSPSGDASGIIEGFLVNREAEELVIQAERDRDYARKQRSSLALLLAATCRQTRSYLDPTGSGGAVKPDAFSPLERGEEAESDDGHQERRSSVISVNSVLSDIYQIAMTEAESSPPVFMPIEFERFFHSLGGQVRNTMRGKGISLRFELSDDLPERLSGPAPLLRHALERALLAVTAPVRGGGAEVSLMRDPNAPKSHGMARVLFSVTWSRFQEDAGAQSAGGQAFGSGYTTLFAMSNDPEATAQTVQENTGTLEIAEEREVIRYLVQKMRGDLLDSMFTSDLRSLRMIITLSLTAEGAEAYAAPEESAGRHPAQEDLEPSEGLLGEESPAPDAEELAFVSEVNELTPVPDASSLELLAMNDPGADTDDYDREDAPPAGEALDILLVDDNLNNRLLFSLFLRDTRHRITEAHDGQQGVEAFQHGRFDLIFLDMEMPLMDGYLATRIIRALEMDSGKAPTPIVAMTTYALPEFRRQCMLAGCSDFLSKPFTKNALLSMLDAFAQIKDNGKGKENA